MSGVQEVVISQRIYALKWEGNLNSLVEFPAHFDHSVEADGTLLIWQANRPIYRAKIGDYIIFGVTKEFFVVTAEQYAQDYAAA